MTDTVFGIEYPRPLMPLFKMVGPLLEDVPQAPHPPDSKHQETVREWLDGLAPVPTTEAGLTHPDQVSERVSE